MIRRFVLFFSRVVEDKSKVKEVEPMRSEQVELLYPWKLRLEF